MFGTLVGSLSPTQFTKKQLMIDVSFHLQLESGEKAPGKIITDFLMTILD